MLDIDAKGDKWPAKADALGVVGAQLSLACSLDGELPVILDLAFAPDATPCGDGVEAVVIRFSLALIERNFVANRLPDCSIYEGECAPAISHATQLASLGDFWGIFAQFQPYERRRRADGCSAIAHPLRESCVADEAADDAP